MHPVKGQRLNRLKGSADQGSEKAVNPKWRVKELRIGRKSKVSSALLAQKIDSRRQTKAKRRWKDGRIISSGTRTRQSHTRL